MPKILPESQKFSIFSLQFYLNWFCILPPDCDKCLKHFKSFLGEDTLILATTSMQSPLLISFPSQDLHTSSLGQWSSPCLHFSLDYKTVAHSVLRLAPFTARKCWNQLSNTNLSKLQKERSFLIDIMQIKILILHRVVQELSNNIKPLLPTYSSHLSLNGNRHVFLPFSSLSLVCFFFFFPA